jgi:predicted ATPase/DNA-binding CsgD family transcriptional regulator
MLPSGSIVMLVMVDGKAKLTEGNLPAAVTSFVGRRHEIERVRQSLAISRLVTLTGGGGVGKTRLALEVATDSRRAFADGVWLVNLAAVKDGELVAHAVASELGVQERSTQPPIEQVAGHISMRPVLLVLDNCEHLVDACATAVDRLLRLCPALRVLATSRITLGIDGERVCLVPSLSSPDPSQHEPVAALGQYEAVRLLVERAGAVQAGFAVTPENSDAVARLCAGLDGIPLAIELAATRLRSLSVEEVADRLEDRFELLTSGSRAAQPRQRTLRALIDWSYDLCSSEERRLWARLSVFAGGFDRDAAEQVCGGEGLPQTSILGLIDRLIAQSIIERFGAETPPRFRMLETIRQYGHARLVESGEHEQIRRQHRDFFIRLARECSDHWCGPAQAQHLARLREDHSNLRATYEFCVGSESESELALALCGALCWHWCTGGFLTEGRRWLDQVLALPAKPSAALAEALWVAGWVALLQGDHTTSRSRLAECDRLAQLLPDPVAAAHATNLQGSAALFTGDPEKAILLFERAMRELSAFGLTGSVLLAQFQLSGAVAELGQVARAEALARDGIETSERCGDTWARSLFMLGLGRSMWINGDLDEAERLNLRGLELQRGFRDSVAVGLMIEQLSWLYTEKSDYTRAARLLGTADAIWRSLGTSVGAFGRPRGELHTLYERRMVQALREPAFRAAFAEGAQPTATQAIEYALKGPAAQTRSAPEQVLTRRERQVAAFVAEGFSNRQIAERLVVSPRTVDGHVEHVLAKLGFTSRAQVAAWVATQHAGDHRPT